jgi:hypothetical protein
MPRKVSIIIDEQGNIESDFMGFAGDDCQTYEQRLRDLLQGYGVMTTAHIQKKALSRIAEENRQKDVPRGGSQCPKVKM